MPYEVVNLMRDTEDPKDSDDNKVIYEPGDPYPREGDYEPGEKRIKELSTKHKKYKRVFIKKVEPEAGRKADVLTASEIKKMNKGPQKELIKKLGGDPEKAKNEDERIALLLELQSKEPSPE
ncbi:hypothetical protein [Virgibacillus oceani]|uniref:YqbF C-terminal domain-containing protein n=1 Tax=Virgibacillus oceani TaxID=1479511 RepID=A0A917H1P6_9BACI|nr:hypothetical protein [Virgibacillus oceani]GGG64731.1 hypothetical protein GCM10011398_05440 [Virgibacillus oceani]